MTSNEHKIYIEKYYIFLENEYSMTSEFFFPKKKCVK